MNRSRMPAYLILVVVLAGVTLLLWVWWRGRGGEMRGNIVGLEKLFNDDPRIERLVQQDEGLSEAEIDEALALIRTSERGGAQTIVGRLQREDPDTVRRR